MLRVDKIYNRVGNGVTDPYTCTCEDGKIYFIKYPNNPWGKKILINEFICYSFAKELNLSIPNYNIVIAQKDLNHELIVGTCFVTEELTKVIPTDSFITLPTIEIRNSPQELLSQIMFDCFVGNNDRCLNKGNTLYKYGDKSLFFIDYSSVFFLGSIWDKYHLKYRFDEVIDLKLDNPVSLYRFLFQKLKECNYLCTDSIQSSVDTIKNKVYNVLHHTLDCVPTEWVDDPGDMDALRVFLEYRSKNLDIIINKMLEGVV